MLKYIFHLLSYYRWTDEILIKKNPKNKKQQMK